MLDVFSRTISRRSYDQLGALKPLFGVACPLWWGKESPCSSTSSRSAPDGRLVTRRQPNSAPDRGHLMACKRTWQVTRPVAPHVSRPIPLGFRARSHWPKRRSSPSASRSFELLWLFTDTFSPNAAAFRAKTSANSSAFMFSNSPGWPTSLRSTIRPASFACATVAAIAADGCLSWRASSRSSSNSFMSEATVTSARAAAASCTSRGHPLHSIASPICWFSLFC
jgi:hypothetical protein